MIGETVSHYRVLDKLGGGGMGVVYRAQDLKLERLVALKFLPPSFGNDEGRKERFIIEAKAASALDHPNIGTIYEVDETDDGRLFIAMAYYRGETLKKKLQTGPLPLEDAIDVAAQVARGLAKVHAENIIHRDIKPANVIVTEDGLAKILDFGLAKLATVTSITGEGAAMGTPVYMSPEQTRGDAIDARTDLWSLGVLLFEMSTGETPFKGGHPQAVVHSILNDEPNLDPLRAKYPELVGIVQKALVKDPGKRYPDAGAFLRDLDAFQAASDADTGVTRIQSGETRGVARRGTRTWTLALVALGILAVFSGWRVRESMRVAEAITELERVVDAGDSDETYRSLRRAGLSLDDPRLAAIAARVAGSATVASVPTGARVEVARLTSENETAGSVVGVTPWSADGIVAGEYLVRLHREGYTSAEFLLTVSVGEEIRVERRLAREGAVPDGMIYVEEGTSAVLGDVLVPAFLIDRTEVTHAEYLEFVAGGGYTNPAYWTVPADSFVDRTGIPGPRVWSGGTYPEGRGEHPVVGITWHEAAAYARWAEKDIPGWAQWWRAALGTTGTVFPWGSKVDDIDARANFGPGGTRAVGSYPRGISPYGVHDLAGNVREWVREPTSDGRYRTVGGSWLDPSYMFEPTHAEAFDERYANEAIGFRCVKAIEE